MLLTSENVNELLNANAETKTGVDLLIDLGFRTEQNTVTFGVISKTVTFGARILRLLELKLDKGTNARLPKMEFQLLDCEYLDEPLDISELVYFGEIESNYTVYKAYKIRDVVNVVVLRAQNGVIAIVKAI